MGGWRTEWKAVLKGTSGEGYSAAGQGCQRAAGLCSGCCPLRAADPLVASGAASVNRAVPGARVGAGGARHSRPVAGSCPGLGRRTCRGVVAEIRAPDCTATVHKPGRVRANSSLVMAFATVAGPIICQPKRQNQLGCLLKRTFRNKGQARAPCPGGATGCGEGVVRGRHTHAR